MICRCPPVSAMLMGGQFFCANPKCRVDKPPGMRYNLSCVCGRSSSGRARPCQGRGSEFEPRRPLQKETPSVRMVFSFWNVAGRPELAASTCAKRVKSRGKGRVPANGSAIRGMPVASRASLRFFAFAVGGSADNKACGQSQKEVSRPGAKYSLRTDQTAAKGPG